MPKPRNDTLYVKDMHEALLDIASFVDGYDFARFSGDKKTIAAVLRNFEILGEAASRVPDDMRELAPEIDWRGIKDFAMLSPTSIAASISISSGSSSRRGCRSLPRIWTRSDPSLERSASNSPYFVGSVVPISAMNFHASPTFRHTVT